MKRDDGSMAHTTRHSLFDDVQGLVTGSLFVALGVMMFGHARLLTGGTVGLSFLGHYASGVGFGKLFFVINLPFYGLAWKKMGRRFTIKTFLCVAMVSVFTTVLPRWLGFAVLHPLLAAVAGGLLIGAGLLILFRHQGSLGGLNILVLYLQEKFGWRAGWVQMGLDVGIVSAGLLVVDWPRVGLSVLAAVALNLALAVNHRPGRYMGM
ncbi:MAG: YitT family protein [Phycisphaeraceae bacterium]|nr:YitT family protein [Phycisphaeraceae bacterium]